jgi:hypothetical protein
LFVSYFNYNPKTEFCGVATWPKSRWDLSEPQFTPGPAIANQCYYLGLTDDGDEVNGRRRTAMLVFPKKFLVNTRATVKKAKPYDCDTVYLPESKMSTRKRPNLWG